MTRSVLSVALALLGTLASTGSLPAQSASAEIGVQIQVISPPEGMTKERNLTFGTLTPGEEAAVAPSVSAASSSALLDIHSFRPTTQSVTLSITFPTRLTNVSRPSSGALLPVFWDGANVFTCTKGATLNACLGSERSWTVPAAPVGASNYSFEFTACAAYQAGGTACAGPPKQRFGSDQSLYVAIGGRAAPAETQLAGSYRGTILVTLVSTSN